tara:strand:+ start:878 stop:1105 length:228 start_codon:yes stop_codon:yes gene_type:complete
MDINEKEYTWKKQVSVNGIITLIGKPKKVNCGYCKKEVPQRKTRLLVWKDDSRYVHRRDVCYTCFEHLTIALYGE